MDEWDDWGSMSEEEQDIWLDNLDNPVADKEQLHPEWENAPVKVELFEQQPEPQNIGTAKDRLAEMNKPDLYELYEDTFEEGTGRKTDEQIYEALAAQAEDAFDARHEPSSSIAAQLGQVGVDTEEATIASKLSGSGLPITAEGDINIRKMEESGQVGGEVTIYNVQSMTEKQKAQVRLGGLTDDIVETLPRENWEPASKVGAAYKESYQAILKNVEKEDSPEHQDASGYLAGHSSGLVDKNFRDKYMVGSQNIEEAYEDLASTYLDPSKMSERDFVVAQKGLSKQLALRLPQRSKSLQASFGGEGFVSHMDALPKPSDLPAKYQPLLKPARNMSGGEFDPKFGDNKNAQWGDKFSMLSTLTGEPYVAKSRDDIRLNQEEAETRKVQSTIENLTKGILSKYGLAKDEEGRKLSTTYTEGTAEAIQVSAKEYFGGNTLDQLARAGVMDEADIAGDPDAGIVNQARPQRDEAGFLTSDVDDVVLPDIHTGAQSGLTVAREKVTEGERDDKYYSEQEIERILDDVEEEVEEEPEVKPLETPTTLPTPKPKPSLSSIAQKVSGVEQPTISTETLKADSEPSVSKAEKVSEESQPEGIGAIEALESAGLKVDTAVQGSQAWKDSRKGILTSTGIGSALGKGPYGDNFETHIEKALLDKKYPEIAERQRKEMFDAGTQGEEAGKAWYEREFDKRLVDAGLITDPSKPNQGTSVDAIIADKEGKVDPNNLQLSEFKWGTQGRMPQDADKKHIQQLQHQMYMTGAKSVDLTTGYDPNQYNAKRGTVSEYKFDNQVVPRDENWAENNADYIQKMADLKADVVSGKATKDEFKEALLEARELRFPNGEDKGDTTEQRQQDRVFKEQDRERSISSNNALQTISAMNRGGGGGGSIDGLMANMGRFGQAGMVAQAAYQGSQMIYDTVRAGTELVGEGQKVGADSTSEFVGNRRALIRSGLTDEDATNLNAGIEGLQSDASVGEFGGAIKIVEGTRGLLSMDDVLNNDPQELQRLFVSRTEDLTPSERAGMARKAGFPQLAIDMTTDEQKAEIAKDAQAREDTLSRQRGVELSAGTLNKYVEDQNMKAGILEMTIDSAGVAGQGIAAGDRLLDKAIADPVGMLEDTLTVVGDSLVTAKDAVVDSVELIGESWDKSIDAWGELITDMRQGAAKFFGSDDDGEAKKVVVDVNIQSDVTATGVNQKVDKAVDGTKFPTETTTTTTF